MKLNKKVLGMLMSGALVFGMVGCSSDESNEGYQPKQETKQEQQYEEPKDESLNEEYMKQSTDEQAKEVAKELIQTGIIDELEKQGFYNMELREDRNVIMCMAKFSKSEIIGTSSETANDLEYQFNRLTSIQKETLDTLCPNNNVIVTMVLVDENENVYLGSANGETVLNVWKNINKLN